MRGRGKLATVQIDERHLLQRGITAAADELAGGVDVDKSPLTVGRLFMGSLYGGGTQEVEFGQALLQFFEILRIVPGLAVVKANRAGVLVAAPDHVVFAFAAPAVSNILQRLLARRR